VRPHIISFIEDFRSSLLFDHSTGNTKHERRFRLVKARYERAVSNEIQAPVLITYLPTVQITDIVSWDNAYDEELQNFHEMGDEGEIWYPGPLRLRITRGILTSDDRFNRCVWFRFGLESVEKIVDWILDHYPIPTGSGTSPSILEIGCGNGTLLFAAHEAGYNPERMYGIDYSENAISLAKSIASKKETEGATSIKFTARDFLTEGIPRDDTTSDGWNLILDKGTFDAISLGKKGENGHAPHRQYPQRLSALMKPGGRFLITCEIGFYTIH
jgi:tRNA G46 methylase TrmB